MELVLTEIEGEFSLYKSWVIPCIAHWRYRDWQIQPSQTQKGWWKVTSRLIESNEDGDFLSILDIEDPLEFRSHQEAVAFVFHDSNLVGRLDI
jgi:hypothetical protein